MHLYGAQSVLVPADLAVQIGHFGGCRRPTRKPGDTFLVGHSGGCLGEDLGELAGGLG